MKVRLLIVAAAAALAILAFLVGSAGGQSPPGTQLDPPKPVTISGPPGPPSETEALRHQLVVERGRYRAEHGRYIAARKRVRSLLHVVAQRPSTGEAINLACTIYSTTSCSTLWRIARCESGYSATAHNGSGASGLFQFLPSTWAGTPFGRFSIWSPYANALAAGWMWARGRGGEWVCR